MHLLRTTAVTLAAVAGLTTLAACGDDSSSADAVTTSTTAAASSTSDVADTTTGTVDANTASVEELTAAFEAAGIPEAERWAREVEEYRPYPTDDPTFAKLRQELSKYNPSDDVVEAIISTLTL